MWARKHRAGDRMIDKLETGAAGLQLVLAEFQSLDDPDALPPLGRFERGGHVGAIQSDGPLSLDCDERAAAAHHVGPRGEHCDGRIGPRARAYEQGSNDHKRMREEAKIHQSLLRSDTIPRTNASLSRTVARCLGRP